MCRDRDPLALVGASVDGCDGGTPLETASRRRGAAAGQKLLGVQMTRSRNYRKLSTRASLGWLPSLQLEKGNDPI